MRTSCVWICLAIVAVAPALAQTAEHAPWLGTWILDSTTPPAVNSPYKRVVLRLESADGDGLKATYDLIGTRGGVTHMEWSGKFDGKDYAMQGLDYVMTNAYTKVDAQSYTILVKLDGVPRARTEVSISADGLTMTTQTSDIGSQQAPRTAVYRRKR